MRPESLMMTHGYDPNLSEGAVKCPIFQTSTFVFHSAQEGKSFFELAYGLREKEANEELGLIYSRINNPNLEILENRLCLWDRAEACAVFESGMSAISTVLLEFLNPGDLLLYSNPLYGGTDHFIHHFLHKIGVHTLGFMPHHSIEDIHRMIQESGKANRLAMIFIETPANPTNHLVDIGLMRREIAEHYGSPERKIHVAVDNTYMGPLWQHPLEHGADLVLYSATKYIGGHSDLIAGAVLGSNELIQRTKVLRTFLGNMVSPHTAWLLLRSLETLKVRMDQQTANAQKVAKHLNAHPLIRKVHFLGMLPKGHPSHAIYKKQCSAPGAMLAFDIEGGEKEAFAFLDGLKLVKLAVSLGSTESLAEHPRTMTHAGVDQDQLDEMGVGHSMIRLSVGVEHYMDLISDIDQALERVSALLDEGAETLPT